ncbi:chemotaxis protein CheX [Phosphitispora fastidiosa]|uniref:chemotaxis protein CheX n=1 Tax=Phosphitispora fastidiosa TaxID=2837202 RepID=UPI001E5F9816|nr:chemotaxis protein CheX [Phosphitispora fastidiosa]MBU7007839.1 chemotaxis protein CheX [Phosphitispora fastidiosa]
MKVEFVSPFVTATIKVLETETGRSVPVEKGQLTIEASSHTCQDVTVLIGVIGAVQGIVMYGMSERTAKNIVSALLNERVVVFNEMVESAVAEMGNVITGIASSELEKAGYSSTLAPPTVISGRGVIISTINIKRIQIPLITEFGGIEVGIALRENNRKN